MANNFNQWDGKVLPPSAFAHVVLRTNNMPRMRAFYIEFLGARVVHENDSLTFITYDDEHHRLALVQHPDLSPKVKASCGVDHFAYAYSTLSDLLLSYRHRQRGGMLPFWSVNHGPTISLYYKDPDGNVIELQADNFDTNHETDAFMKSASFAENPVGTDVDPEDLIRRLESGESELVLKRRVEIGPRSKGPGSD